MKNIVLTAVLICASFVSKAQNYGDYDTMIVYYHPILEECVLGTDTNKNPSSAYTSQYYNKYMEATHPPYYEVTHEGDSVLRKPFTLQGMTTGTNNYKPQAFAQPYYFANPVIIIGVSAHVGGWVTNLTKWKWRILDEEFNELGATYLYPWYSNNLPWQTGNDSAMRRNYGFESPIEAQNFYISGDVEPYISGQEIGFGGSRSIFDTIWQDTIIGCQSDDSPLLKKNGEWIRFADDTVYMF
jgi:hypothetical protein